jgi:hypothetical protein
MVLVDEYWTWAHTAALLALIVAIALFGLLITTTQNLLFTLILVGTYAASIGSLLAGAE